MSRTLAWILILLLPAITTQAPPNANQYLLSPNLPPTAFIGQYYTCNFRVSGLSAPKFTFSSLPDCFTPSSSGSVEGIPNESGSYSITVNYQQGSVKGQQVVVLRVAEPDYNASLGRSLNKPGQNLNWIQLSVPSTYRVGDRVAVNLNEHAKGKYTWSYLQLPEMLAGDSNGNVNGVFYNEGYYSFGATCSDDSGNSLDYFFTVNIQPLPTSFRSVVVEVPNRNVFRYNFQQIDALERSADANLAKAQKVANQASDQLGKIKGNVDTTKSNLDMAQKQVAVVEKLAKIALDQKGAQFNRVNNLEIIRDNAQAKLALKQAAYDQSAKNTGVIQSLLNAASSLFDKMTSILAAINKQFITAQNDSIQAAADLAQAKKNVNSANQDVNSAFKEVSDAKKVLQAFSNNNSVIGFNVNNAFDEKDIANFQNDAANSAYNTSTSSLKKALQDLQAANSTVYELQLQAAEAKHYLGQAEFNLVQAMNALFVAQAAKEQSDKAILIASAQSSQLPTGTSTYIFSGCEIGNYPVISGTASITASSGAGFELSSGYNILYGSCTEKGGVAFSTGDTVCFQGYLKNGYIHGVKIAKQ